MKVRAHAAMTVLLNVIALCLVDRANADWTHWRGPEQNGISRERGLVDDWSLDGKNIRWQADIGGRATPIIMQGRVYLNCRTVINESEASNRIDLREQVVCFDLETGDVLWRDEFNVAQTDIAVERVGWASMAGDPETGHVYMHSVSGLFRCYTRDGKRVWEHSLGEEYGKLSGFGGRTQTPIIDEDRVVISFLAANWGEMAGPAPEHYYYAFDKRTGELQWVSAPGGKPYDTNYSIPIVKVVNGVRMLIGGNSDGGIYAMQARTGKTICGLQLSKRGLNTSPVIDGTRLFISHGEDNVDTIEFGRVECLDIANSDDPTRPRSIWRVDGIKAGYTGLLVHDGILYVVADTGTLHALDAETGSTLWTHNLGTTGRGSPVWADGKLYVTEVHGNVFILKPSREQCVTLSHVTVPAREGSTYDGIFASPAIANGNVVIVTRDRTICLADARKSPVVDPLPKSPQENKSESTISHLQLTPYEVTLRPGGTARYQLRAYDRNGRLVRTVDPKLMAEDSELAISIKGDEVTAKQVARNSAGTISASLTHDHSQLAGANELTATARVRTLSVLPWVWDFEKYSDDEVPAEWVRATRKIEPREVDGSTAMLSQPGRGRPSTYIWLGDSTMSDYTIQADVMLREERRRLSNIGITAQRYNLTLKGNTGRLEIQSWAPQLRMAKEVPFRVDPDVWYTLKLHVETSAGKAIVRGKAWPRDEDEPTTDTIRAVDPHPNTNGSPGLYLYTLADCYFDNVRVTRSKKEDVDKPRE